MIYTLIGHLIDKLQYFIPINPIRDVIKIVFNKYFIDMSTSMKIILSGG